MKSDSKVSIVTVVYEGDLTGLKLQARSFALHADSTLVGDIFIIENFKGRMPASWRADILAEYGLLSDNVRFVPIADLFSDSSRLDGWWSQQVAKIEISKLVTTSVYLVLDAKHHLLKQLNRSFIYNSTGQLRIRSAAYAGHPLENYLHNVIAEFGINPDFATKFPTTTPPFPIITETAKELLRYAADKSGGLSELMVQKSLTEFFLYSGFLASKGELAVRYELHDMAYPMIWHGQASDSQVVKLLAVARNGESPFFAVHRRALPELTSVSREKIAAMWVEAGLFDSSREAANWLRRMELKRSFRERVAGRVSRLFRGLTRA